MDRYRARICKRVPMLLVASALFVMSACERPVSPDDTPKPPRPETVSGYVITAELALPARPVPVSPGWM